MVRLTKRMGFPGTYTFHPHELESLEECLRLALADDADFIIDDERGIIDYRIGSVRKSN